MSANGSPDAGSLAPETAAVLRAVDRSGAVGRVLLLVFVYFMSDAMFQTLLPVSMDANGITSGFVIGIFIAAASGVGILLAPPATAWGDRHGRARVLFLGGLARARGPRRGGAARQLCSLASHAKG